ncbi:uncharacterized protein N7498_005987 [Penicillium cinerascens]|uniref:Uncharacterized protein n=1 Tax=Penicillium cinerascens TaxID=70096 RepID=A0A9W9MPM2_9EURO|nr:uncharacterized protein N7498_005987 [Penicillium cinerascens]KAJ5205108.1 hypothetical protein N7498_005987 [Penicillium cinerascens]
MFSKLINPPTIHGSSTTYSHVQATGISPTCTFITIAGQVGLDFKTGEVPSSLAEQIQVALQNLNERLKSAGATPANLTSLTHYVVDLDPNDTSRSELVVKFLAGHRPPGTLVGVAALAHPSVLYEVQATAIVHKR